MGAGCEVGGALEQAWRSMMQCPAAPSPRRPGAGLHHRETGVHAADRLRQAAMPFETDGGNRAGPVTSWVRRRSWGRPAPSGLLRCERRVADPSGPSDGEGLVMQESRRQTCLCFLNGREHVQCHERWLISACACDRGPRATPPTTSSFESATSHPFTA